MSISKIKKNATLILIKYIYNLVINEGYFYFLYIHAKA